jgi:hypothetical protein
VTVPVTLVDVTSATIWLKTVVATEEKIEGNPEASEDVTESRTYMDDAEFVNVTDGLGMLIDKGRLDDTADWDVAGNKVEVERGIDEPEMTVERKELVVVPDVVADELDETELQEITSADDEMAMGKLVDELS